MIRSHGTLPLQYFLLIGWLVFLPLKQRIKYKKLQYLHPGAGSSDEVTFRKILPTSNQGNVQVEMLSFLTTLGVSHCFQGPLLQRWFGTPKLADPQQLLVWHGSGTGKDIQLLRTHQAFQP